MSVLPRPKRLCLHGKKSWTAFLFVWYFSYLLHLCHIGISLAYYEISNASKNSLSCKRISLVESKAGFTLIEVMVASTLVALFLASLFELNAVCLRSIDSGKESLAALQSVQDRNEVLRNLSFSDLTTASFVQNLMAAPANPAPFSKKATEVVTINKYPVPNGSTQFTRSPSGSVTVNSMATDLGSQLVKVNVQVSWTMTAGGRARVEATSCLVSNGTKK